MAISQRTVDKILANQSNSARKVYDILREDPWTVNRIVQELRNANAGNTPDRKVVSGCLNDMTDAKVLKRTGHDMYSRAPVRKDSSKPLKVSEFPPLVPSLIPRPLAKEIIKMAKEPVTDKVPIHVSKAQAAFDRAHEAAVVATTPVVEEKPPVPVPAANVSQNLFLDGRTLHHAPGEITDPLLKAYMLANEVADMADVLARMSVAIRESAIELEKERDKVRVKSEKIEKLTEALRELQLGD